MQSDDHDVPHSPEWISHLPQPIRHIRLPARALVPTGCAFNRHRFLPPKKYHRKKQATKKEREQQLETKSKKERHHRTRAQCKKLTTQWTYLNWPDSPLSLLLLLPPLRLWQEASLIRLLLKLALSSLNLEDERERERERRSKRRGIRCWDVRWGRRVESHRTRRHGRAISKGRDCANEGHQWP